MDIGANCPREQTEIEMLHDRLLRIAADARMFQDAVTRHLNRMGRLPEPDKKQDTNATLSGAQTKPPSLDTLFRTADGIDAIHKDGIGLAEALTKIH